MSIWAFFFSLLCDGASRPVVKIPGLGAHYIRRRPLLSQRHEARGWAVTQAPGSRHVLDLAVLSFCDVCIMKTTMDVGNVGKLGCMLVTQHFHPLFNSNVK